MLTKISLCAMLVAFAAAGSTSAQQAPSPALQTIKRTPLQKFDVPGTAYETLIGIAEIVPNANIGRHTHFGVEAGYLLEGEVVLLIEGQPPRTLKAGESYQIPAGAVHDGRSGARGGKVIATYVVEKGKSFATAAP